MRYARIPNPILWTGKFPAHWTKIAESSCPKCKQPIGYNRLSKQLDPGHWQHCDILCHDDKPDPQPIDLNKLLDELTETLAQHTM